MDQTQITLSLTEAMDMALQHHQAGRLGEAESIYRQIVTQVPGHYQAFNNMGLALYGQGKLDEAIQSLQNALAVQPDYREAFINLGNIFKDQGNLEEAIGHYQKALAIDPDCPYALNNMGEALREHGYLQDAIEAYRHALETQPDHAQILSNVGNAFKDQGLVEEGIDWYIRALKADPYHEVALQNLIYSQQFLPETTLETIQKSHQCWQETFGAPYQALWGNYTNDRDPQKKLVLGFVSGDFRYHPVGYFTIQVFEQLAQHCHLIGYANQLEGDDLTARFQTAASQWHTVCEWSDEQLAQQIRADQVDILFDLTGHNARNRLAVFAQKPAPLQVTWAGYMATTGLNAMDYIIADATEIPAGAEQYYTEQVIRMPHSFICYEPHPEIPDVNPLPALNNQHITFGSFNILTKITPSVVTTWSEILNRLPESRLILKTRGLDCPTTRQRYLDLFAKNGVSASRITCYPYSSRSELWPIYQQVDIQLDPFPFSGSTTTLESLWMGVPVITLPGETFASRHSLSYLSTIGLTDFVAQDRDHYIRLAVDWSHRLTELSEIRKNLRTQVQQSPLCDAPGFTRDLLKELRRIWTLGCKIPV
jgi:protein O-GlcNAc transferase